MNNFVMYTYIGWDDEQLVLYTYIGWDDEQLCTVHVHRVG